MKRTVNVTRTEFASANFDIDIPDSELVGMCEEDVDGTFASAALVRAGDHDFGSGNAEYEVDSVEPIEEAGV